MSSHVDTDFFVAKNPVEVVGNHRMIEIGRFEEITQIRMTREVNGKPQLWVSAYLIDGLLVDTGCGDTAEELAGFLASEKLDRVVNTHHHEDHIGGNKRLQEQFNVEILAHADAMPMIARPPTPPSYREAVWGTPEGCSVSPLGDRIRTDRFEFQVIETPGHCPGHVALVEPGRGWCFSGDLYVGEKVTVCGPENNVDELVTSMNRLLELDTARLVLLTAMRIIEEDGRRALQSSIEHFGSLYNRAKDLHCHGLGLSEIVDELLGGESVFDRITNGQYSSANLVRLLLSADL
jgi:glyoxylase-like metal-dependent hydrolase (beta-lactamase superfamily II)